MKIRAAIVNVCRFVLAVTFVFSGYVKAIDPLGTQYKIHDYAQAAGLSALAPDWLTLSASAGLSGLEFTLGMLLLFAIRRRLTSRLVLAFMVVMTLVTVWLFAANPISDCGCFGDALKLTNGQTLAKNIVLLAMAAAVAWRPHCMVRFISRQNQWIVTNYTILFVAASILWSLYTLPPFDFRPYHVGANLREGMEIPEGASQPQFETTFILEKDGEQREFTLDDYPDSTWTFVDSKSVQTAKGYEPPIHDFSIVLRDADGTPSDDITDDVLQDPGYTFLLIAPHLQSADDGNFGDIDQLYEYAATHNYPFYCLTASTQGEVTRWIELTGAEYPFCTTDETTLKTIVRSNPGLLLLKDATVVGKWSHNRLPRIESGQWSLPLEKLAIGQVADSSKQRQMTAQKVGAILLWFVLPLALLTFADRLWALAKRFFFK